jgi:hypothetical protein
MTLNVTEPNSSPITEISDLLDGGDCDNVNIFSFKLRQQSDGCATNTDPCKHVKVELLVAITLTASVTICILNSVCTVRYTIVCVSLLLQKQTTYCKLQSQLMGRNYITISLLAGSELIKEFTTKDILHTHNSPRKSHTSANFTS